MVAAFDIDDVNANPARFDPKKAEALNATWIRRLDPADLAGRLLPFLQRAGVIVDPAPAEQVALLEVATPLVQERMTLLEEAPGLLGFLFVDSDTFRVDHQAAAKVLGEDAKPVLMAAVTALEALPDWKAEAIGTTLKEALVDGLGLKPRQAFAPIRVAVSGRTVSPPLYESIELLGRDRTLARLRAAAAR
jgi:glutamyl-tRNA synthetase